MSIDWQRNKAKCYLKLQSAKGRGELHAGLQLFGHPKSWRLHARLHAAGAVSGWKRRTAWDEVCRRASGRRRYNRLRCYHKEARQLRVAELLQAYGPRAQWPRGTQRRIAAELKVSTATICRDVDAILQMNSNQRALPDLATLRSNVAQMRPTWKSSKATLTLKEVCNVDIVSDRS